jgi:nucleotide-binding universal stress UspA family protein
LRWAAAQSQLTGTPLWVVHAWQMSELPAAAIALGAGQYREAAAADVRARATRWVQDTFNRDGIDLRWTLDIVLGAPGAVLVSRSAGAELLVLGAGAHTRLRRAAAGSIGQHCLSHAVPPVIAVPADSAKPDPMLGPGTAWVAPASM